MSEITKLYENAGIDKMKEIYEYPPFTAEKQIRLVEILSKRTLKVFTNEQPFCVKVSVKDQKNDYFIGCEELNFGSALANLVSHLWQDLTEEEKQQIKEILE